jgi:lysophospholipase L1-like esterase
MQDVLISWRMRFVAIATAAAAFVVPTIGRASVQNVRTPARPTLFLIGDSTVKVGTAGQVGWGDRIAEYFDNAAIDVINAARGGRSSRTYVTEGLWDRVLEQMKAGDFVIVQFGHNDGSALFTGDRPRGSIKGTGEETQEGTVDMTGRHEVVHTFGWYLRKYVADTRARGATPIVCSPIPRNVWKEGRIVRDDYAMWARDVAASSGAAFVDLNDIVARRYDDLGTEAVTAFFPDDHTHTNAAGAEVNAAGVVAGLKALRDCRLCAYFSGKAAAVPGRLVRVTASFLAAAP